MPLRKTVSHRTITMPPDRRHRIAETADRMGISGEELIGLAIDRFLACH